MQAIPRAVGSARPASRSRKLWNWPLAALAALLATAGCTRAYYHNYADNDVYDILKERLFDWRWKVPERPVEAAAHFANGRPERPQSRAARHRRRGGAAVSGLFAVPVRVPRLEEARHDTDRRPELAALRSARIRRQGPAQQGFDHADRHGQQPRVPVCSSKTFICRRSR